MLFLSLCLTWPVTSEKSLAFSLFLISFDVFCIQVYLSGSLAYICAMINFLIILWVIIQEVHQDWSTKKKSVFNLTANKNDKFSLSSSGNYLYCNETLYSRTRALCTFHFYFYSVFVNFEKWCNLLLFWHLFLNARHCFSFCCSGVLSSFFYIS